MKRRISWVLGGLAYIAPPTWAYFEQASIYGTLRAQYGYVCGLPMLAIVAIACIAATLLSGLALWLGWLSFRALPRPRPRVRIAELAVISIPFILPSVYLALLLNA